MREMGSQAAHSKVLSTVCRPEAAHYNVQHLRSGLATDADVTE
jgi:hypothetical protein